jgi:hypothetical protein
MTYRSESREERVASAFAPHPTKKRRLGRVVGLVSP